MPWVRTGDTAITHPRVMAASVVSGADSRTRNELFGFVSLLGTMSAAHLTDSVVEMPAVHMAGGPDADRLLAQATECGLLTPTDVDGRPAWKIIDDPDLIHILTRAEVEHNRTRKRDNSNGDANRQIQLRDGSACRYCGQTVNWKDRRGGRGGTYDHLVPGQPALTPADRVVSCKSCNSSRGAAQKNGRLAEWDAANPLRPVPTAPFYCAHLAAQLGVPATGDIDAKDSPSNVTPPSADAERPAPPDPAPTEKRPRPRREPAPGAARPGRTDPAHTATPRPAEPDLPGQVSGSQLPGTGRARSGRDEKGRPAPAPARARRSRRGRRSRANPGKSPPTEQERRS